MSVCESVCTDGGGLAMGSSFTQKDRVYVSVFTINIYNIIYIVIIYIYRGGDGQLLHVEGHGVSVFTIKNII